MKEFDLNRYYNVQSYGEKKIQTAIKMLKKQKIKNIGYKDILVKCVMNECGVAKESEKCIINIRECSDEEFTRLLADETYDYEYRTIKQYGVAFQYYISVKDTMMLEIIYPLLDT